jgi:hypothetical protein
VHGLLLARAVGALVREDHGHRAPGARRVIGAFHLETAKNILLTAMAAASLR